LFCCPRFILLLLLPRRAAQTFRKGVEHIFVQVRTVHTVVFVLSLFGALLLWLALVLPTLKCAGKESRQIAEMLSQLPPEMDVEGIIAQVVLGGEAVNEQRLLLQVPLGYA
jgi:hypothetical protein